MTRLKILTILLLAASFSACDKRPFAFLEIHGRIISAKKNQPVQATIFLSTGAPPGNKGWKDFGNTHTNSDGSFDIKSNEGWSSDYYHIEIMPDSFRIYPGQSRDFTITRNQNVDAGTIGL
jgi:hypothetical protein